MPPNNQPYTNRKAHEDLLLLDKVASAHRADREAHVAMQAAIIRLQRYVDSHSKVDGAPPVPPDPKPKKTTT